MPFLTDQEARIRYLERALGDAVRETDNLADVIGANLQWAYEIRSDFQGNSACGGSLRVTITNSAGPVASITVTVTTPGGGTLVGSTDMFGQVLFTGLSAGTYTITITDPCGGTATAHAVVACAAETDSFLSRFAPHNINFHATGCNGSDLPGATVTTTGAGAGVTGGTGVLVLNPTIIASIPYSATDPLGRFPTITGSVTPSCSADVAVGLNFNFTGPTSSYICTALCVEPIVKATLFASTPFGTATLTGSSIGGIWTYTGTLVVTAAATIHTVAGGTIDPCGGTVPAPGTIGQCGSTVTAAGHVRIFFTYIPAPTGGGGGLAMSYCVCTQRFSGTLFAIDSSVNCCQGPPGCPPCSPELASLTVVSRATIVCPPSFTDAFHVTDSLGWTSFSNSPVTISE